MTYTEIIPPWSQFTLYVVGQAFATTATTYFILLIPKFMGWEGIAKAFTHTVEGAYTASKWLLFICIALQAIKGLTLGMYCLLWLMGLL